MKASHTSKIATELLLYAYKSKSSITFNRLFDFNLVRNNLTIDDESFMAIFRRLKLLARLNPWPATQIESAFIDIGVEGRLYRFPITFDTIKNQESVLISEPIYCKVNSDYAKAKAAWTESMREAIRPSLGKTDILDVNETEA